MECCVCTSGLIRHLQVDVSRVVSNQSVLVGVGVCGSADGSITKRTATQKCVATSPSIASVLLGISRV